jgi:hypothetical protein
MPTTRTSLHVIATHVLGRRRFAVSGHFGLRASPDGLTTPAFGPEPEVVRTAGPDLIHEVGSACRSMPMDGATLAELAAFVQADLAADYSPGAGAPAVGSPDEPMHLVEEDLDVLYGWFDLGTRALDVVTRGPGSVPGWATTQLWPEHFDVGSSLDLGSGRGVNLGFSPGDGFSGTPYAYVGPWGPERPGQADYWNAPFGAVLPQSAAADPQACVDFLHRGLALLGVG